VGREVRLSGQRAARPAHARVRELEGGRGEEVRPERETEEDGRTDGKAVSRTKTNYTRSATSAVSNGPPRARYASGKKRAI